MIKEQFINYLLATNDSSIVTTNNIDERYFSGFSNEWKYIKNHIDKYGSIPDRESFLNRFPDFDIIDVKEPKNYLVDSLFKNYQKESLASTFNNIKEILTKDTSDDDEAVDKALEIFKSSYESLSSNVAVSSVDILKDTSRYDAYEDRINNFDKYFISTGLKELDELIGGWDREEELATIAARTNIGKSWMLLKFALAALEQGLNVGMYSGEMSEKKVGYRLDTLIQHIPNGALIHGNAFVKNDYKNYIETLPERFTGCFRILTPKMLGHQAGVSDLQAFIERDHLDVLFIDQHSLLRDDRKAKNPVEKASNISLDLQILQKLKKIPIIAVSQQNRTSTSENGVGTEHIAQSDRISQDSTIVMFFERNKDDDSILTIDLVKSRDSENNKKLNYKVDFNTGNFVYIPDGSAPEAAKKEYSDRYSKKQNVGNDFEDIY